MAADERRPGHGQPRAPRVRPDGRARPARARADAPFTVVVRCTGGHPLVIRNAPRDASGAPFPTTYWLRCPDAVKAVARLEAAGWIARFNERERSDEPFADALAAAHHAYAEERAGGTARGGRRRRRRRHRAGREVPARPLRVPPGGRRRSGRRVGRGAGRADPRGASGRPRRRDRSGDELDPAARGGARGAGWRRPERARARHGHHAARRGRRPDGPDRPRRFGDGGRARPVLSPRPRTRTPSVSASRPRAPSATRRIARSSPRRSWMSPGASSR